MAENDAASLKQERPTIEASTEDVITPKEVIDETPSKEPLSTAIDATLDTVPNGENADETHGTDTIQVNSELTVLAEAEPVKEGTETINDIEPETIEQEEPVYSGLLSYKKASATFPIYHKRHFYFSNEAVPLDRLYAFYEKYKKLKVDKDELDHLVAHAATSGVGLFFFSKTPDAIPSGILECSRMIEIKADEHMHDKFSISYGPKQVFSFETGLSSRDAWVAGVNRKKTETAAEIERIRTSAVYISNLRALEDGTAFHKVDASDSATHEVFSDDETPVAHTTEAIGHDADTTMAGKAAEGHETQMSNVDSTSEGQQLQDKTVLESPDEHLKVLEKTSKKEKRRSFLAGFLSKKEATIDLAQAANDTKAIEGDSTQLPQVEAPGLVALETNAEAHEITSSTRTITGSPKSPLSPLKEKVDGFFSRFKRNTDKNGPADPDADSPETTMTEVLAASATAEVPNPVSAEPVQEIDGELKKTAEAVDYKKPDTTLETTSQAEQEVTQPTSVADAEVQQADIVQTPIADKRPNALARRLTSLFKGRRHSKQVPASTAVTSQGPPQLPETAKIEPEPQSVVEATVITQCVHQTVVEASEGADVVTEDHVALTTVVANEDEHAAKSPSSA